MPLSVAASRRQREKPEIRSRLRAGFTRMRKARMRLAFGFPHPRLPKLMQASNPPPSRMFAPRVVNGLPRGGRHRHAAGDYGFAGWLAACVRAFAAVGGFGGHDAIFIQCINRAGICGAMAFPIIPMRSSLPDTPLQSRSTLGRASHHSGESTGGSIASPASRRSPRPPHPRFSLAWAATQILWRR